MYINYPGHVTKMTDMPIYSVNRLKIFFSTYLRMKPLVLEYYNVYINHDPVMTLTYFTARST